MESKRSICWTQIRNFSNLKKGEHIAPRSILQTQGLQDGPKKGSHYTHLTGALVHAKGSQSVLRSASSAESLAFLLPMEGVLMQNCTWWREREQRHGRFLVCEHSSISFYLLPSASLHSLSACNLCTLDTLYSRGSNAFNGTMFSTEVCCRLKKKKTSRSHLISSK